MLPIWLRLTILNNINWLCGTEYYITFLYNTYTAGWTILKLSLYVSSCHEKHVQYNCWLHGILQWLLLFIISGSAALRGLWPPCLWGFLITHDVPVSRTPLDEWSAHHRDLYLTTHTTDKHPFPPWDLNRQSQQASGLRPMPWTAWPLEPVPQCLQGIEMEQWQG
jgi:hypothetical protein